LVPDIKGGTRLRVFEKRVLRKIFGGQRNEVTRGWKRLHNDELHSLYCLRITDIIRMIKSKRMRWAGHIARVEEKKNAYRILVGKPEEKRPLGRPGRRWIDNIKMNLKDTGWVVWTGLMWLMIGTSEGLL
jgi:hypothetical protein